MTNLYLPDNHIAIEEEVSKILEICAIKHPPVDAFLVAEKLGYEINVDDKLKTRGYKRRRWGKDEIIVNSPSKSERKHFTIAHEIAEHALAGKLTGEDLENACNAMASSLLMPARWFEADAKKCNYDLLELKKTYSTASHEAIVYRMLQFSACIITIFDNGKVAIRKASTNSPCRHIHPVELKCFQRVSDDGKPHKISEENVCVQGWPAFKDDWKRVILRTEMDIA